ncbi:hypothetical protein CP532_1483 [Ophiocordyceps camponoti-leonardi (nom. inval.)]|nr:hypothetical protein CP532_1483 [Ophiocordyceps camponoti-leonardi (nom. inval.)]
MTHQDPDFRYIIEGTGRVLPTSFTPPPSRLLPHDMFEEVSLPDAREADIRLVYHEDFDQLLIFTNGYFRARDSLGSWAFAFNFTQGGTVSGRLERRGPFGDEHRQSPRRAHLRAILAALRYRPWHLEGFTSIVIATTSEELHAIATYRIRSWITRGWRYERGGLTPHSDLWKALLGEVEKYHDRGLSIYFWNVHHPFDTTYSSAVLAAYRGGDVDDFTKPDVV